MARGKKVEPHVASLIKIFLDAGRLSCVQIAKELGLSAMTIYRIRLNYDLYNAPYPPSFATKGRPQAFTPEQQAVSLVSIDAFWLVFDFRQC
jgi:transposase